MIDGVARGRLGEMLLAQDRAVVGQDAGAAALGQLGMIGGEAARGRLQRVALRDHGLGKTQGIERVGPAPAGEARMGFRFRVSGVRCWAHFLDRA